MLRSRYITDELTILVQRDGHILLEARGRYITDDPTIRLYFVIKKNEKILKMR